MADRSREGLLFGTYQGCRYQKGRQGKLLLHCTDLIPSMMRNAPIIIIEDPTCNCSLPRMHILPHGTIWSECITYRRSLLLAWYGPFVYLCLVSRTWIDQVLGDPILWTSEISVIFMELWKAWHSHLSNCSHLEIDCLQPPLAMDDFNDSTKRVFLQPQTGFWGFQIQDLVAEESEKSN